MEHRYIGRSGLRVLPIALGTMTFATHFTMATAWSKQFKFVASTIIGATHPDQLDATLAAMDLTLSDEVLKACDDVHNEILYPMG